MELFEPLKLDDFDDHNDYVHQNYIERDLHTVDLGEIRKNLNKELIKVMNVEFQRYKDMDNYQ